MRLTRRTFIGTSGAAVAALGLGVIGCRALEGRVYFDEDRALPGMKLRLTVEVDDAQTCEVALMARYDGQERVLGRHAGAQSLEFEVPAVETEAECYALYAVVENAAGRLESEPVEVLSQPYRFGM